MFSRPSELPGQVRNRVHVITRTLAIAGILALVWHDIQPRYLPGLLPFPGWSPPSVFQKWLGIGIDAFGLFVLLITLFGSVICTSVGFINSKVNNDRRECWIDLCFAGALYLYLALS